ncbi:hypothetical protein T4A_12247 [Trichinella pseudospiralis]|uniref:Uncharacterized protein n=1 Tax=Trichinella pseudospiralis TaxID=6337 RepID=A0A0V1DXZ4_TRIPS|nr:hypothetical protein T4A_12247 [Trichinella pseudospiralis]
MNQIPKLECLFEDVQVSPWQASCNGVVNLKRPCKGFGYYTALFFSPPAILCHPAAVFYKVISAYTKLDGAACSAYNPLDEKAPIMSCSVDDVSNHWQNASDAN